ncbi:MAG: LytTR family DNA-binding domain-containing protein [Saprospiraceae bacterium]|nr:LytTR family DNA-binding domain-containing protein [Saprospiraceae bacterium]
MLNAAIEPPSRGALYRQAVIIGTGVFAVLAVFQPFGTYVFKHDLKYLILAGYGLLVPLTAFVLRESVALFRADYFAPGRWTFRRELIFSGVFLLVSVVLSYFYQRLAIGGKFSVAGFFSFIFYAVLTAILPLGFFLVWRFFDLKNRLVVEELSQKMAQKPEPEAEQVVLQGENKHEKLTLLRREIRYLRAADNYVEIFLLKNGQTQRHMLRGALSHILQQLEHAGAFRQVHRSYVVNFDHALRLEGKSPAYFLVFENAPDAEEIPVSRQAVADVRALLAAKPR